MLIFGYQKLDGEPQESQLEDKFNKLLGRDWKQNFEILDSTFARIYYQPSLLRNYHGRVIQSPYCTAIGKILEDKNYQTNTNSLDSIDTLDDLMSNYWGDYVILGFGKNEFSLARSHFSQTPMYYIHQKSRFFFSTKLKIVEEIFNLSLNTEYLSTYLIRGDHLSLKTPINKVQEVPTGCKISLQSSGELKHHFFKVSSSSLQKQSLHQTEREDELDNTLFNVINNYTEPYNNIFLEFSGGIDSTALLFYLKKAGKSPTLLNYYHSEVGASNELAEAKKIADQVGAQLIPFDSAQAMPFTESMHGLHMLDKPTKRLLYMKKDQIVTQIMGGNNSILMSGVGGDELFISAPIVASLSDLLLDGKQRLLFQKMIELSNFYTNATFYRLINLLIRDMVMHYYPFKRSYKVSKFNISEWMSKNTFHSRKSFRHIHDAILNNTNYKPGKLLQMRGLYDALSGIQINGGGTPPIFYPMLTKPMIKFMNAIPTYELYNEHYDRILLRNTLNKKFNTNLVWRKYKGQTTGVFQLGLRKNKSQVLDLIRNGLLVGTNVVEFEGIKKSIDHLCKGNFADLWPIAHLYSLELYLEAWKKSKMSDILKPYEY